MKRYLQWPLLTLALLFPAAVVLFPAAEASRGGGYSSQKLNEPQGKRKADKEIALAPVGGACTITCPANMTQANDSGQCGAVVNYAAPTTTGTCGAVNCSPASGSFFPVGTTTVTCTVTGGPSCNFTVTVQDAQPPTITCPANVTQGNDPNQCGAVVNYPAPTAADNCPGVSANCSPASGSFFPVGTTTVTCTASDASVDSPNSTCTFTVTVNDTQAPSITCPANISVPATAGFDGAVVDYPAPTVTDNCPGAPAPVCNPASGSFFPIGVTTVTCSAGGTSCVSKTVTHSSSQAITPGNSVSCNDGVGHTDNHYWRAFNLPSFSISGTYHVQSVDIGIEGGDLRHCCCSFESVPYFSQRRSKRARFAE